MGPAAGPAPGAAAGWLKRGAGHRRETEAGLGWEQPGREGEGRSRGVLLTLERPWEVLQPLEASGLGPLTLALPTTGQSRIASCVPMHAQRNLSPPERKKCEGMELFMKLWEKVRVRSGRGPQKAIGEFGVLLALQP